MRAQPELTTSLSYAQAIFVCLDRPLFEDQTRGLARPVRVSNFIFPSSFTPAYAYCAGRARIFCPFSPSGLALIYATRVPPPASFQGKASMTS